MLQKIFETLGIKATPSQDEIMEELYKTEEHEAETGHLGTAVETTESDDSTDEDVPLGTLRGKRKIRSPKKARKLKKKK